MLVARILRGVSGAAKLARAAAARFGADDARMRSIVAWVVGRRFLGLSMEHASWRLAARGKGVAALVARILRGVSGAAKLARAAAARFGADDARMRSIVAWVVGRRFLGLSVDADAPRMLCKLSRNGAGTAYGTERKLLRVWSHVHSLASADTISETSTSSDDVERLASTHRSATVLGTEMLRHALRESALRILPLLRPLDNRLSSGATGTDA